jgi:hypothetical protein
MDIQTLILIGMFLGLIAFTLTLYHLAHGNEQKAVELGARLVMESLQRQGAIAPVGEQPEESRAFNLDDEFSKDEPAEKEFPDIILTRSAKAGEQIGDRLAAEMMAAMDKEQGVKL